jgi:hypothetical protein
MVRCGLKVIGKNSGSVEIGACADIAGRELQAKPFKSAFASARGTSASHQADCGPQLEPRIWNESQSQDPQAKPEA